MPPRDRVEGTSGETSLPENPMKKYLSYRTFFTVSLDRNFTTLLPGAPFVAPRAGPTDAAILLLDSRGEGTGRGRGENNKFPQFSVRSFDITHRFASPVIEATAVWESTLVLYERGGAAYLQLLGESMGKLGVNSLAELVLWVGVGIYGWVSEDSSAKNLHPQPISQKWFPSTIQTLDMNMDNSGSEYSHWLTPASYAPIREPLFSQINTVTTCGVTLGDHTLDLINTSQEAINEAKERAEVKDNSRGSNKPTDSGDFKKWKFDEIKFEPTKGFIIDRNAPLDVNVQSKSRKGIPQVSSGGPKGHTTVISHIETLLKNCPVVTRYLKDNKLSYKIYPRVSTSEKEMRISYIVKPFIMVPEEQNILPMRRYNYFFGQKNEDVIKFDLQIEGLHSILPGPHVDTSQSRVVPNPEDTTKAVTNYKDSSTREGKTQKTVGGTASQASESDKNSIDTNFGTSLRDTKIGSGFTPYLPTREEFGTSQTDEAAKQWKGLANSQSVFMGESFLKGGFTIVGDPYLIWDESQINDFREKGIDIEGVANYITFTVGTPGGNFPDNPDVDNFIFSGPYTIEFVKSQFADDGGFTQTIGVAFKPAATPFGGATTKVPAKTPEGLVSTSDPDIISQVEKFIKEISTVTPALPQPIPKIPSVDPKDIATIPYKAAASGRQQILSQAKQRARARKEARIAAKVADVGNRVPIQDSILPSSGSEGDEGSI